MIKRLVQWRLKQGNNKEGELNNAIQVKRRLESLRGQIPGMLHIEVGIDTNHFEDAADIALYAEFENEAALDRYNIHPENQRLQPYLLAGSEQQRSNDGTH